MIIWLTGHSGSGKTTIAKILAKEIGAVVLDGNEMRESISESAGFSREDRREHNFRVARLAGILSKQMSVIISVIAPLWAVRKEIDFICAPTWVYCKRDLPVREGHFYEESKFYFTIDIDSGKPNDHVKSILDYIEKIY